MSFTPSDETASYKHYHPYQFITRESLLENNKLLSKLRLNSLKKMKMNDLKTISPLLLNSNPFLCKRCISSTSNVLKSLKKQSLKYEPTPNTGLSSVVIPSSINGKQDLLFISKLCSKCQINWEFRSKSVDRSITALMKKSDSRIHL